MLRLEVGDERIEHLGAMQFPAVAVPVGVAEGALADEFGQPRARQRREMRIGEMRQPEARHAVVIRSVGTRIDSIRCSL
jgi:hypothetical protein